MEQQLGPDLLRAVERQLGGVMGGEGGMASLAGLGGLGGLFSPEMSLLNELGA